MYGYIVCTEERHTGDGALISAHPVLVVALHQAVVRRGKSGVDGAGAACRAPGDAVVKTLVVAMAGRRRWAERDRRRLFDAEKQEKQRENNDQEHRERR